jgi:antitoxin component of MazEF toxin-antitoxin module
MDINIHPVRKIMAVGHSLAVSLPPYVCDHLGAKRGDLLHYDLTVPNYVVIHRVDIPPYALQGTTNLLPKHK